MAEPAQSENGWVPGWVGADRLNWVKVPGAEHVSLQFMKGWPTVILRAFAADYHAYIEPLRDADSAAYTSTNSVWTSNHKNGTGCDLNWQGEDGKTFRYGITKERAYPGDKSRRLDELLAFYEGTVFCGGEWSIRDWMHFQLGGNTYNNPRTGDFILRKIRPDGFSTFRRGDTPTPAATDPVWVLSKATGLSTARAAEILPAVTAGLIAADCTNPARIAMYLAQVGHESVSFKYTEEIAKNGRYAPYIGRTWIQITWDYNYRDFGKWCFDRGLVPSPDYFVRDYRALADLKWAGLGPAWYWTVARKQLNAMSDARDLNGVTKAINGGYNGLSDRQTRYNLANTLGGYLLVLVNSSPELSEWDALMADATPFPSQSAYRDDDKPTLTALQTLRNLDTMNHEEMVEKAALLGQPWAVELVARLASGQGPAGKDAFKVEKARNIIKIIQDRINAQVGTK